jgi:ADP-L-glycero-D-manno-heptose 6-epimerase
MKKTIAKKTRNSSNHTFDEGNILVTGGAGFIGSALIAELNARGHENIIVVDRLGCDERFKNLVGLNFNEFFLVEEFEELISAHDESSSMLHYSHKNPLNIQTVFHLGAESSTTECDADWLIENNYRFSQRLSMWAISNDIRFVYASSAATYGDGSRGMRDTSDLNTLRPLNIYGYSKHLFDKFVERTPSLKDTCIGLKYFNIFGPNENHKSDMRSMVSKAFEEIKATGKISLFKSYNPKYANGEQLRDFLYVRDAVKMTLHLARQKRSHGLYNIGSGKAHSWINLAHAVFEAMGLPPKIEFIDMPESMRNQYQYHTCADINKLKDSGYFTPITSFKEAVREYVQDFLIPNKRLEG